MTKIVKGALLAGVVSLALGGIASAQTLTSDEAKCQAGNSKAGSKFVGSKAKCAIKCQGNAAKAVEPIGDCYAPYAGLANTCINDPLKGAEAKYQAAIVKACTVLGANPSANCPNCYDAGKNCTGSGYAGAQVQNIEGQVDSFGPGVFCVGYPGGNAPAPPSAPVLACEINTAKTLSKLVGSVNKCYDKCFANARKALIPQSSCVPPASDPATSTCINGADTKSIAGVNKKCGDIGPSAVPDCDTTNGTPNEYPDGATWTNLVDTAISGNVYSGGGTAGTYCSSPSGAFLE